MESTRERIMRTLADKYYYFLTVLPFEDELYMQGMVEPRRKFLANLHITLIRQSLPPACSDWRYSTDHVSEMALHLLQRGTWNKDELIYEHMVPKTRYIKEPCEAAARRGVLTPDYVYDLLVRYLWTATIHASENERLAQRTKMPPNWDEIDVFARYKAKGIILIPHNKEYLSRV